MKAGCTTVGLKDKMADLERFQKNRNQGLVGVESAERTLVKHGDIKTVNAGNLTAWESQSDTEKFNRKKQP